MNVALARRIRQETSLRVSRAPVYEQSDQSQTAQVRPSRLRSQMKLPLANLQQVRIIVNIQPKQLAQLVVGAEHEHDAIDVGY